MLPPDKQAAVATEQAKQAVADAGYHAPKTPLPMIASCPRAFDPSLFGIYSFPTEHQLPTQLDPTNYAVSRSSTGGVCTIYAGSSSNDPEQGLVVISEEEVDPCAVTSGQAPVPQTEYLATPFRSGAVQITSLDGDQVVVATASSATTPRLAARLDYVTGTFQ